MKIHKVNLVFIAEPKIRGDRATDSILKMRFQNFSRVDAVDFSAGLWALRKDMNWNLEIVEQGSVYIHLKLTASNGSCWACTALYANPNKEAKEELFKRIKQLAVAMNILWLVLGILLSF